MSFLYDGERSVDQFLVDMLAREAELQAAMEASSKEGGFGPPFSLNRAVQTNLKRNLTAACDSMQDYIKKNDGKNDGGFVEALTTNGNLVLSLEHEFAVHAVRIRDIFGHEGSISVAGYLEILRDFVKTADKKNEPTDLLKAHVHRLRVSLANPERFVFEVPPDRRRQPLDVLAT